MCVLIDSAERVEADLMKTGTVELMRGGMPAALDVYDDGLVYVSGSKGAQAGLAFGALGALIGGAAARKGLAKRRAQLDAMQPTSAMQVATVEGCDVLAPNDIQSIEIKKGLIGAGRWLTIHPTTGRKLRVNSASKPPARAKRSSSIPPKPQPPSSPAAVCARA